MIVRDFFRTRNDEVKLYRTYSDQNFFIENENGVRYAEAIDVDGSAHTYAETDIPIAADDGTVTQE